VKGALTPMCTKSSSKYFGVYSSREKMTKKNTTFEMVVQQTTTFNRSVAQQTLFG
jgi:hypothetical protein